MRARMALPWGAVRVLPNRPIRRDRGIRARCGPSSAHDRSLSVLARGHRGQCWWSRVHANPLPGSAPYRSERHPPRSVFRSARQALSRSGLVRVNPKGRARESDVRGVARNLGVEKSPAAVEAAMQGPLTISWHEGPRASRHKDSGGSRRTCAEHMNAVVRRQLEMAKGPIRFSVCEAVG